MMFLEFKFINDEVAWAWQAAPKHSTIPLPGIIFSGRLQVLQ